MREIEILTIATDDKSKREGITLKADPDVTIREIEDTLVKSDRLYRPPPDSNERIEWIAVLPDGREYAVSPTTKISQLPPGTKLKALYKASWG